MSGHKRATIKLGQIDTQRMEQLNNRLRQVEENYQEITTKISQHREEELTKFSQAMLDRHLEYAQVLGQYHSQLGDLEIRTNQALDDHTQYILDDMNQKEENYLENSHAWIEDKVNSILQVIQQNQELQNGFFNDIQDALDQNRYDLDHKFLLAKESIDATWAILQSIDKVYDHQKFYPGFVDQLIHEYEIAERNLSSQMPEAAFITAQQIQHKANYLRINLENCIQQTALSESFAIENARRLENSIDQNRFVHAVDLSGNFIDYEIDVDFWSGGQLKSLHDRCIGLIKQLSVRDYDLEISDFERISQTIIPQMEQSLGDIVAKARLSVLMSQVRFNIAEYVVDALQEQGFVAQQEKYIDQDERLPYQVITSNYDGSEVKVFITSGNQPGSYNLQVDSEEAIPITKNELYNRTNTILDSLRSKGLRVSEPMEVPARDSAIHQNSISKSNQFGLPLKGTHVN